MDIDSLRVTLRGERLPRERLIALERERPANLHALLVDASRSMIGKLEFVRDAATEYVRQLRPEYDRAMVVTFDDSVVMVEPPTADVPSLIRAIDSITMGGHTSLHDGLIYTAKELDGHPERPVIVLITDGADSASFFERDDVRKLIYNRPRLAVFTIALGMEPLRSSGPPGGLSSRRYLKNLAYHTNGRHFDVSTGGGLEKVFLRIREMLENEATLTLIDLDLEAPPGKVDISTSAGDCKVRVLRGQEAQLPDPSLQPIEPPFQDPPLRLALSTSDEHLRLYDGYKHLVAEGSCGPAGAEAADEPPWYVAFDGETVELCALDVVMETGAIYDPWNIMRMMLNGWIRLETRLTRIPLPELLRMPTRPEQVLDELALHALSVADVEPVIDPRQKPRHLHARPHDDQPGILHGNVFLQSRPRLAQAMFGRPDYRRWTLERLSERAGQELARLAELFAESVPDASPEVVELAVRQSDRGREILARAERPSESDVMGYLAAWLGDIPAHELFVHWETRRINLRLETGEPDGESFVREWDALRRLFFAPSYSRTLTLMRPIRDEKSDRVGFWRVILPRPAWLMARLARHEHHPEYAALPLDLVPDAPFGFLVLERLAEREPAFLSHLLREGYRVVESNYELTGPYRHRDPRRAFDQLRVRLSFEARGERALDLAVDLARPPRSAQHRIETVEVDVRADPRLAALVAALQPGADEGMLIFGAVTDLDRDR